MSTGVPPRPGAEGTDGAAAGPGARPSVERAPSVAGSVPLGGRWWARSLGTAALLLAACLLGRHLRPEGTLFSLLWPAAGLAVWWFAARRPARVRALDAGLLLAVVWLAHVVTGSSPALAGVNLVHGLVGARALRWCCRLPADGRLGLARPGRLLAASAVAGGASGLLSTAVGAAIGLDVLSTLVQISLRNTAGTFLVLVLVLALERPGGVRELVSGPRLGEWAVLVAVGVLTYLAAFAWLPQLPLAFSVFPMLAWSGSRMGLPRTAVLSVLLDVLAVAVAVLGDGVFFAGLSTLTARAAVVQLFLVLTVLVSVLLATSQEERGRAVASLAQARAALAASIDAALIGNGVLVVGGAAAGRLLHPNPALQRLLGVPAQDPGADGAAAPAVSWFAHLRPEDLATVRQVLEEVTATTRDTWTGELAHVRADSSLVWAQVHLSALPSPVAPGLLAGAGDRVALPAPGAPHERVVVAQFLDVTARKDAEAQLVHLALHDELTGLPNRVLLRDHVALALAAARRSGALVALVFLDLDDFKSVNDSLGHEAGDRVLRVTAQRLGEAVRASDTVARIGGDEFVVCCPEVDSAQHAEEVAARLLEAVGRPVLLDGRLVAVGASAGLTVSGAGDDAGELLRRSDTAMYAAKRSGRGRTAVFDRSLEARADRLVTLTAELREALVLDQFVVHYQPVVDLADGAVTGCEALVRWRHPVRGLLPPGDWLDVAEGSDVVVRMGEQVLRRATADLAEVARTDRPLKLHVNVSGRQLAAAGLVDAVAGALEASGLPPHLVVVELTETHLLEVHGSLLADLSALHRLGVEVSVDDFGTGFSSLAQLVQLPVDGVKVDRSLVAGATTDDRALAVVRGVLGMAEALGLGVVAEGVEEPAQADLLRRMGCPSAQGYLWSPPVDLATFRGLLREPLGPPARTGA
ncbi:EAL domain-containing protein [uncultured Pseudokineococcus sp.]|uniref:putative bifunctional diguanylate cyclase/phosphodiesterase n=1 Tax=uncultured Pseudokineococcus sp. TaxID=1642928 RepID=UPI00262A7F6D|nr:EAL domain-containing protein [uncultured Pseudokineococcus sp.]